MLLIWALPSAWNWSKAFGVKGLNQVVDQLTEGPMLFSWDPAETPSINAVTPDSKTDARGATAATAPAEKPGDPKSLYKEARSHLKPAQKPDFAGPSKAMSAEKPENNPVEKLIRQSSLSKQPAAEASGFANSKKVLL